MTQKSTLFEKQGHELGQVSEELERIKFENSTLLQTITDMTNQLISCEDDKRKLTRNIVELEEELDQVSLAYEKKNRELKDLVASFVYQK